LKVKVTGLDKIKKRYKNGAEVVNREIGLGLARALRLVQGAAKMHLTGGNPLWVRSGRLRQSVNVKVNREGKGWRGKVGTNVIYGPVHEFGKIIKAKGKGWLRFPGKEGWATVKKVTIPRRPWLGPAFRETKKKVNEVIRASIRKSLGVASA
jgi:phage gpG-like protein